LVSFTLAIFIEVLDVGIMLLEKGINDSTGGHNLAYLIHRGDELALLEVSIVGREEFLKEGREDSESSTIEGSGDSIFVDVVRLLLLSGDSVLVSVQPGLHIRFPTNIGGVNEQHTTSGDGRESSVLKIGDLEQESHRLGQWDSGVGHKGQDLVIVHDSVQGLDPEGIDDTVEHDPLPGLICLVGFNGLGHTVHDGGEHTPHPLLGGGHETEELIGIDGLRVDDLSDGFAASVGLLSGEALPHGSLTRSWWADDEHTMSDDQDIFGLDDLEHEAFFTRFRLITELGSSGSDLFDKLGIDLLDHVETGEEISNQSLENGLIIDSDLSDIELFETGSQEELFRLSTG
jgi:hypothetical protein